jgi:choline dehydrogenase
MNATGAADGFDYIVVGAGSAGCVLANRLTASGRCRTLVLEAGGEDRGIWLHIPLGYGRHFTNPTVNWLYTTEPEADCGNRRIIAPRGKVLGGSSSINGLIYIRGQAQDFDHWRQLGNPGWSFEDVLPYFRKAEGNVRGADAWHGADGPLAVSDAREAHPLADAFLKAAEQCGHGRNADFNGATQEGFGYYQTTTRNGRRCSTAVAYLKPARRRPNLAVIPNALATRVLFEGRRAVGVEYLVGSERRVAHAAREVILAGGAFNSPQLLQLSGVGPAALLRSCGIEVLADHPGVGAELQDHYQARLVYRCTEPCTVNDTVASLRRRVAAALRYGISRRGALTVPAIVAGGFLRTDPAVATPDVQGSIALFSADEVGGTLHPFSGFTGVATLLRPRSRGHVRIRSADPREPPAIQPRYLSAEHDRGTIVAGLKTLRRIFQAPAMARHVAAEHEPGPACQGDADLLDYIRRRGLTVYHPTSTCRMGTDATAVVDARLRVHGLAGLRVIDASIMPTVVSGNTNAATIMIAEKGADMVLEDALRAPAAAAA